MKHRKTPTRKLSVEELQARLGRRASGAAGTHGDRRTKRRRTRAARKATAIAEFGGAR